jgi:hypothetical protein
MGDIPKDITNFSPESQNKTFLDLCFLGFFWVLE